MDSIKNNWQELIAYTLVFACFSIGIYFNFNCTEQVWIAPAGSLTIVVGVLLACSRKIEIVEEKIRNFTDYFIQSELDSIISEHVNPNGEEISDSQREIIKNKLTDEVNKEVANFVKKRLKIFKWHEVVIVIWGTLINGLGDMIFKFVQ